MHQAGALTRRDFIATTAVGAVALWRGDGAAALVDEPLLYVGTYTENGRRDGIHLLRMNSGTGALRHVSSMDAGPNPSFLAIHPDGRTLFAVNEVNEQAGRPTGALRSFAISAKSGGLAATSTQDSEGAAPCYVSTDRTGRVALVANYVGGTVALLGVRQGGVLTKAQQVVQHVGAGKNPARQEKAHAHCILPHPGNRYALAADLGVDRVLVYELDVARGTLRHVEERDAVMAPGTGPRHLAFHPSLPFVYVSGELNSSVSVLRCDPDTASLTIVQSYTMLPEGYTGENYPADIHVSPDGRALYVSNRGLNTIAAFRIAPDTGLITPVHTVETGGDWPRNFTLDPTGRWLLVANQRSDLIVVFSRDVETGRITPTSQGIELPSPVCLRFATGPTA